MLNRLWRVFATGFVFIVFGLGAVLISATVFPVLRLSTTDTEVARLRIQRAMQLTFKGYVWLMRTLGLLTYEVQGVERLWAPGQLVIANHPSLIDVVFLVSLMPTVDCIVKQGLWRNPFLRWPVSWASYIPNTSGEALIYSCAATLKRGNSLLVFPEGTRSVPGQRLRMQRGAAHIALVSGASILPVTVTVTEPILTKGYPWYRVPKIRPHFCIKVGEPWPPNDYNPGGKQAAQAGTANGIPAGGLAARQLTERFGQYYAVVEAENLRCAT
ncbi:MAG: lysophospholipid acyltransferase family protein [Steroidobacteraceae bacterium]